MSRLRGLFPAASGTVARYTLELGNPADYLDRTGYDPDFVSGCHAAMPGLPNQWRNEPVPVDDPARPGEQVTDLRYFHFSTVLRSSRRMPFFACVNIDGKQEQKIARRDIAWRYDPRVPPEQQLIADGIYGRADDGLFSRGHMVRREDPNWGELAVARTADSDTFHVTNACPQVQGFNAPIWLALEDHIKNNAWQDDMRVSVLTGPVFDDESDPWYRPEGKSPVQVPVQFWKVVVFRHDVTGEAAATAYIASQASLLPGRGRAKPQFVFGAFEEFQLRIADLAEITRLDFGVLPEIDVLQPVSEGFRIVHRSVDDVILRR